MSGFQMNSGPVLDYASPRTRGRIRLPSQSHLELRPDRDGVVVHEWLAAKGSAVAAIILCGGALVLMAVVYTSEEGVHWKRNFTSDPLPAAVAALLVLGVIVGGFIVLLMVVNNTWRRTMLEARRDGILLTFWSPFATRRLEWNADEIEDIRLEATTGPRDRNHLAELEIHLAAKPLVKLFTDHTVADLTRIAAALRNALGK